MSFRCRTRSGRCGRCGPRRCGWRSVEATPFLGGSTIADAFQKYVSPLRLAGPMPVGHAFPFARGARRPTFTKRVAAQGFPTVRCEPVGEVGPFWHDLCGVDVLVHDVVVLLDLHEVDGVAEARRLEQIARI